MPQVLTSSPVDPAISFDDLVSKFRAGEPFPHVVIDDFLTPETAEAIVAEFPSSFDGPAWNEYNMGRNRGQEVLQPLGPVSASNLQALQLFELP